MTAQLTTKHFVALEERRAKWRQKFLQADYQVFLRSEAWRALRDDVIQRQLGACWCCPDRATEVHHASYEALLEPGFCIAVCRACHEMLEDDRRTDWIAHLTEAPIIAAWVKKNLPDDDRISRHEEGAAWLAHRALLRQQLRRAG